MSGYDPAAATLTRDGATLQLGPGWRDERRHLHFVHGCGYTITSAVGDLLFRGGMCQACMTDLPADATFADWDTCYVPAENWRQIKPAPPVVDAHLPGDAPAKVNRYERAHALIAGGRLTAANGLQSVRRGVGVCRCGARSAELPTAKARREWHREHLAGVRAAASAARLQALGRPAKAAS